MAIVAIFDLETEQLDAINAFINSLIDKLVYIKFPPGFGKKGKALQLIQALYGLRCLLRLWQQELGKAMVTLGLC
jgi:hypothetical protein